MNDLALTALTTVVEGSIVTNPSVIAGNLLETTSENKLVQTASRVLQAANMAFLSVWAAFQTAMYFNPNWLWSSISNQNFVLYGALILPLSIPIIAEIVRWVNLDSSEKVDAFQKNYSTVLKVINVTAAAITLSFGILCCSLPLSMTLLASASLLTSAYTLHRSCCGLQNERVLDS